MEIPQTGERSRTGSRRTAADVHIVSTSFTPILHCALVMSESNDEDLAATEPDDAVEDTESKDQGVAPWAQLASLR